MKRETPTPKLNKEVKWTKEEKNKTDIVQKAACCLEMVLEYSPNT